MATTNPTITSDWALLVSAGDDFLLTPPRAAVAIEIAAMESNTPPTGAGHVIYHANPLGSSGDRLTRGDIGPGYVFARTLSINISTVLSLSTWTGEVALPNAALLPNGAMLQVVDGQWVVLP